VTAAPNGVAYRGTVLRVGSAIILVDQEGTDPTPVQATQVAPRFCADDDCSPNPYPQTPQPPLVSRNCGTADCDGDGIDDDLEDRLANVWFPLVHEAYQECGLVINFDPKRPDTRQPVVFRARYMSYGGVVDTNYIAINFVMLYKLDCGPPGFPPGDIGAGLGLFGPAHSGDAESFVVFLHKASDGSFETPASFLRISAVAHSHSFGEKQSTNVTLTYPSIVKPEIWVGYHKHGVFAERSQCYPEWLNLCVNAPYYYSYHLFNLGERNAPFITDLGAVYPGFANYNAWGCGGLLGGPAKISDGLYIDPFDYLPSPPTQENWRDGDIVPNTSTVVFRASCGS